MGDSGTSSNLLLGELAYPDARGSRRGRAPAAARGDRAARAARAALDGHADLGRDLRARGRAARAARSPCSSSRRSRTASPATARPSRAAVSIAEETLRSLVTEIARGVGALVLVNSHFEPEQVETLRATGLPLLDVTRRGERGAADRRVPLRLVPRGPLRDLARPRRSARARPRRPDGRARGASRSTCRRRSGPGRPTSSRWAWTRRTAARRPRPRPRRARETFETLDGHARRADPRGRRVITLRRPAARAQPRDAGSSTGTSRRVAATAPR